jgi:hypothetical protein
LEGGEKMKKAVKIVLAVAIVAIPTIVICQIGVFPPIGTIVFLK